MSNKLSKRYLVTGGAGFIGSHLVDALVAKNHRVTVLDDLSTGKRENVNPNATLIVGDTTDFETVARAFDGIDGCFHLAAVA
ncbi:MAG TPA: NAD-dependent epimerase/dehydratase family protein, partial [Candidatus Baltobacteraceae bacterium]|nr:NAD-dependent epimerase/dehydratase family protein [Candidatus Baltobacteraceae bacterium]